MITSGLHRLCQLRRVGREKGQRAPQQAQHGHRVPVGAATQQGEKQLEPRRRAKRGAHRRPSACGEEKRKEGRTGLLTCTAGGGRAALRKRGRVMRDRAALGGGGGGGGGCGWRLEAVVQVGVQVVEDL